MNPTSQQQCFSAEEFRASKVDYLKSMKFQEKIARSCNSLLIHLIVENTLDFESSCTDLHVMQTCSGAEKTPVAALFKPLHRRTVAEALPHASPLQVQGPTAANADSAS